MRIRVGNDFVSTTKTQSDLKTGCGDTVVMV